MDMRTSNCDFHAHSQEYEEREEMYGFEREHLSELAGFSITFLGRW